MAPEPLPGLRPLGIHGEGYCKICRFIEPLTETGLIAPHTRGPTGTYLSLAGPCKGGDRRPGRRVPYRSYLSAFKSKPPRTDCRECGRSVPVEWGGKVMGHTVNEGGHTTCRQSYHLADEILGPPPERHGDQVPTIYAGPAGV